VSDEVQDSVADLLAVADIEQARKQAAACVGDATRKALEARRHLLYAGFGDDHPECRALDSLAAGLENMHRIVRGDAGAGVVFAKVEVELRAVPD